MHDMVSLSPYYYICFLAGADSPAQMPPTLVPLWKRKRGLDWGERRDHEEEQQRRQRVLKADEGRTRLPSESAARASRGGELRVRLRRASPRCAPCINGAARGIRRYGGGSCEAQAI